MIRRCAPVSTGNDCLHLYHGYWTRGHETLQSDRAGETGELVSEPSRGPRQPSLPCNPAVGERQAWVKAGRYLSVVKITQPFVLASPNAGHGAVGQGADRRVNILTLGLEHSTQVQAL